MSEEKTIDPVTFAHACHMLEFMSKSNPNPEGGEDYEYTVSQITKNISKPRMRRSKVKQIVRILSSARLVEAEYLKGGKGQKTQYSITRITHADPWLYYVTTEGMAFLDNYLELKRKLRAI